MRAVTHTHTQSRTHTHTHTHTHTQRCLEPPMRRNVAVNATTEKYKAPSRGNGGANTEKGRTHATTRIVGLRAQGAVHTDDGFQARRRTGHPVRTASGWWHHGPLKSLNQLQPRWWHACLFVLWQSPGTYCCSGCSSLAPSNHRTDTGNRVGSPSQFHRTVDPHASRHNFVAGIQFWR